MSGDIQNAQDELAQDPEQALEQPTSKRQRRLSKVCEACRQKKSKCDNNSPQCSTCRRRGVECIYREKGQPGVRPGFGRAMEARLELMEANMAEIRQSLQGVVARLSEPKAPTQDQVASTPAPTDGQVAGSDRVGSEGLWPIPQDVPRASPVDNVLTPITDFAAATGIFPDVESSRETAAPNSGLPPQGVLTELVEIFFRTIHPWFPLFHKPTFTASMFFPERELLLHGIVVVCFRFYQQRSPTAGETKAYVKHSQDTILLRAVATCTLVSTQALALLAIDALGQGTGPRAWNIMSMLVTAIRHLDIAQSASLAGNTLDKVTPLVRNDPDDVEFSVVQAEERIRLFWAVCSLDRFSSVSHGQPGGINTMNIKLPYPAEECDWGLSASPKLFQAPTLPRSGVTNTSENLWHHYVDVLAYVDRSNQLLIQPVNMAIPAHCREWQSNFRRLDANLSMWYETLPSEIRHGRACFDPMWIMLQATFHLIRVRMYTVAGFPSSSSPHVRSSATARTRCRATVSDMASLSKPLQTSDLDQLGPSFAFMLWVAARSLIILWTTGYETTTSPDMDALLAALRGMAKHWPCAQRYIDLIQFMLDSHESGASAVREIFNDTRRTAYGLEKTLGNLARLRSTSDQVFAFDFLDIPFLDNADVNAPWSQPFPFDADNEWFP